MRHLIFPHALLAVAFVADPGIVPVPRPKPAEWCVVVGNPPPGPGPLPPDPPPPVDELTARLQTAYTAPPRPPPTHGRGTRQPCGSGAARRTCTRSRCERRRRKRHSSAVLRCPDERIHTHWRGGDCRDSVRGARVLRVGVGAGGRRGGSGVRPRSREFDRQLGAKVRAARKVRRFSQYDAAQIAGIRSATWSQIECGNHGARVSTLVRIADALGVPVASLIPGETEG